MILSIDRENKDLFVDELGLSNLRKRKAFIPAKYVFTGGSPGTIHDYFIHVIETPAL